MQESKKSSLIKKGTISYQPVPLFAETVPPPNQQPKTPEKPVQLLKEKPAASVEASSAVSSETVAKMKEEADKLLEKAKSEAERILEEAKNKGKKIIEEAKILTQSLRENAEKEGFDIGQKSGYEAGLDQLKKIMIEAKNTLEQALRERERLGKEAENDLAQLAVKIAQRVIGSEISLNSNVVVNMIKANLERVKDREHVILRVHQEDIETVKKNKEVFLKFVPDVRSVEIQIDPRADRGGCIIETNLGTVDARITTQLEAISLAFSRVFEQEKEDSNAPEN
jgi:flagellar assembly protein FliH